MRRVGRKILLTLLSHEPGQPGLQLVVTQDDWRANGIVSVVPGATLESLREELRRQTQGE